MAKIAALLGVINGLDHFQLRQWSIDNPRITWSNDSSALLLYARTGEGTFNGHPLAATTLASTLWTKRGDKWLAVHHQETDLTQQLSAGGVAPRARVFRRPEGARR